MSRPCSTSSANAFPLRTSGLQLQTSEPRSGFTFLKSKKAVKTPQTEHIFAAARLEDAVRPCGKRIVSADGGPSGRGFDLLRILRPMAWAEGWPHRWCWRSVVKSPQVGRSRRARRERQWEVSFCQIADSGGQIADSR